MDKIVAHDINIVPLKELYKYIPRDSRKFYDFFGDYFANTIVTVTYTKWYRDNGAIVRFWTVEFPVPLNEILFHHRAEFETDVITVRSEGVHFKLKK